MAVTGVSLRNLPLLWKLLIPFLAVMLLAGVLGAFVIVRDLSARAETALAEDLARRPAAATVALLSRSSPAARQDDPHRSAGRLGADGDHRGHPRGVTACCVKARRSQAAPRGRQ